MAKGKLKLTICRTCLRDNPGEGPWASIETLDQEYKKHLGSGWFNKTAEISYQNCFAQCENFYCLQVTAQGSGYLLKKISTPEKIQAVVNWIREAKAQKQNKLKVPDCLAEHVIAPVEPVTQS